MYYCNNCGGRFRDPRHGFEPYPDFGGHRYAYCPLCGAPENFEREGGTEYDKQGNERAGGYRPQL